jgi:hypothetical protein
MSEEMRRWRVGANPLPLVGRGSPVPELVEGTGWVRGPSSSSAGQTPPPLTPPRKGEGNLAFHFPCASDA